MLNILDYIELHFYSNSLCSHTFFSQFAKTIALGNAIANSAQAPAERFLLPHIENVLPVEYKKWAQPVLTYTIKSIAGAFSLSLSLSRGNVFRFSFCILHSLSPNSSARYTPSETNFSTLV